MFVAAALLAASMIPDADWVEPCAARDGVLLYRESGITLLRLDGDFPEEPVGRDVECAVAAPFEHCSNDLSAAGIHADFFELLGHGRVFVIASRGNDPPDAFLYDFQTHERREFFDAVPEPTTPPELRPPPRRDTRGARFLATGFGSDPSRRAVLVQHWKFAGFSAVLILPTKKPFETHAFLVIPSTGDPRRIDRDLNTRRWDARLLLHDSGTLLIVTGRHIERVSSHPL